MDAKLILNTSGKFTIGVTNGDLTPEDGFDTAINLSLFQDRRASEDQISEEKNRRGSLRDLVSTVPDRKHGSYLWLLDQSKLTPENQNRIADFSQQALNWFVEDGLAKSVIVVATIVPRYGFQLGIVITTNTGEVENHYRNLWELTGDAS